MHGSITGMQGTFQACQAQMASISQDFLRLSSRVTEASISTTTIKADMEGLQAQAGDQLKQQATLSSRKTRELQQLRDETLHTVETQLREPLRACKSESITTMEVVLQAALTELRDSLQSKLQAEIQAMKRTAEQKVDEQAAVLLAQVRQLMERVTQMFQSFGKQLQRNSAEVERGFATLQGEVAALMTAEGAPANRNNVAPIPAPAVAPAAAAVQARGQAPPPPQVPAPAPAAAAPRPNPPAPAVHAPQDAHGPECPWCQRGFQHQASLQVSKKQ